MTLIFDGSPAFTALVASVNFRHFKLVGYLFSSIFNCVLISFWQVGPGSISKMPDQEGSLSCRIPQLDGPIPDPYDDALSTPNVSIPLSV